MSGGPQRLRQIHSGASDRRSRSPGRRRYDAAGPSCLRRQTASANPSEYRDARHGIGTVFQNPEDQIVTTIVEDDVAFGPENLGVARDDIGGRIDESLQSVDMAGFRHADPTRMSGGQQQRIAIAGMLAMNPRMLVLDEPTAMLDPDARIEVMRILDMLQRRGTTIVLVTHHHDETMHADRVLRIDGGLLTQVEADRDAIAAKQVIARSHADATDAAGSTESAAEEPGGSIAAASPAQPAKSGQPVKPASTKSDTSPIPPAGSASDAIAVAGLSYRYDDGDAPVFENLSLRVAEGEIVALMGANGAGKTTLARLLCALDRPSAGSITVAGLPVASSKHGKRPRALTRKERAALRRNVGYVMQHPERQLFADTVAEDVAYGPRNQHLSELEVATRVEEALRMLHIEHLADRSPFNLSGGQQRLVAIAGVIACRPRVLIMDEPTASLDESAVSRIHALLGSLKVRAWRCSSSRIPSTRPSTARTASSPWDRISATAKAMVAAPETTKTPASATPPSLPRTPAKPASSPLKTNPGTVRHS